MNNVDNYRKISVQYENKFAYNIVISYDFNKLYNEISFLNSKADKVCIISDSNVSSLYLNEIIDIFSKYSKKITYFIFEAGERNKNLNTVNKIYEHLIENHFNRNDFLIALGGGVVGDVCGYVAATYMRGIKFIQIPTSLLSQVDSSIGGKTGVDYNAYKNIIGAFHMPSLVYISLNTLNTLPDREFYCGMAEIIKHAFIKDKLYYDFLVENHKQIIDKNLSICQDMIERSVLIKKEVVENDPKEENIRAILNFGHTIGHALEKYMHFKLSHGEAIALGMLCAIQISINRKSLNKGCLEALISILKSYNLPVFISDKNIDIEKIILYTKNDKKASGKNIKFILLEDIGKSCIDITVNENEMKTAIRSIINED